MQSQPRGPVNYLALGDSTGVGVGARDGGYVARLFKRIEATAAQSKLTNLCANGATSRDVLRNQLAQGLNSKPTLVTVGIGINDISHGLSPDEFAENFEAIITQLREKTDAPIVVSNIPDISTAPRIPGIMRGEVERLIVLFNQRISEISTSQGVTVVDIYRTTHEALPAHPEYYSDDGFHPSDEGYEVWAEQMWPAVSRAIGIE